MSNNRTKHHRKRGPKIKVQFTINEKGIAAIFLYPNLQEGFEWEIVQHQSAPNVVDLIEQWVDSYCRKRQPEVSLPLVLEGQPPYTTQVLFILREIPLGVTLSYQELAEVTGNPLGARAVGNACARNPFPLVIPCHRVLLTDGKLGGFSCGLSIKKVLLEFEGKKF